PPQFTRRQPPRQGAMSGFRRSRSERVFRNEFPYLGRVGRAAWAAPCLSGGDRIGGSLFPVGPGPDRPTPTPPPRPPPPKRPPRRTQSPPRRRPLKLPQHLLRRSSPPHNRARRRLPLRAASRRRTRCS